MQPRLIVVASLKGGAGKSTIARALIDLGREAGRTISAHDLDAGSGSLVMLYPNEDPILGVLPEDIANEHQSRWFDALEGNADDVIYDVPGGRMADLLRAFPGGGPALERYARAAGRELIIVTPITHKKDSAPSVLSALETFPNYAKHVIVKNGFYGAAAAGVVPTLEEQIRDFPIYEGYIDDKGARHYGNARALADARGATTIYLPRLSPVSDTLADVLNLTFSNAADRSPNGLLPRRTAYNIRAWLDLVKDAIATTPLAMHEISDESTRKIEKKNAPKNAATSAA